jgi:hypothetical protein
MPLHEERTMYCSLLFADVGKVSQVHQDEENRPEEPLKHLPQTY